MARYTPYEVKQAKMIPLGVGAPEPGAKMAHDRYSNSRSTHGHAS
jgi:hypothetical protein